MHTHSQWCGRGLCYNIKPNGDVVGQAKHFCVWQRLSRSKRFTAIYHIATWLLNNVLIQTYSFATVCISSLNMVYCLFKLSNLHTVHCNHSHDYIYIKFYNIYLFWGIPPWVYAGSFNISGCSVKMWQETVPQSCDDSLGNITESRTP